MKLPLIVKNAYYPKSQIQTDLYTKGEQLRVVSSREEYVGYYWKTSKGEYFSGRNPYDTPTLDLEIIPETITSTSNTVVYSKNNELYNVLRGINTSEVLLIPSYIKPSPTLEDYKIGNFVRYFAKKNNENLYIEISKKEFKKLKDENAEYDYNSYFVFSIIWKLTGNKPTVSTVNQNTILSTEQNLKINGLGIYLKNNYLEFYK